MNALKECGVSAAVDPWTLTDVTSSHSYWHMARTPALQQALSNAWLKMQGLVSVKDLWCKAQGYTT